MTTARSHNNLKCSNVYHFNRLILMLNYQLIKEAVLLLRLEELDILERAILKCEMQLKNHLFSGLSHIEWPSNTEWSPIYR